MFICYLLDNHLLPTAVSPNHRNSSKKVGASVTGSGENEAQQ